MTPAERDAAVALAREVATAHDQFDGHAPSVPVHVYTDGGVVAYDWRHAVLARAVLALAAPRGTCGTCRWWTPAKALGAGHGFCDNAGSPAHNYETTAAWFCADYQAADHSENILDMVGTCKDSLRVDRPADAKEGQ